MSSLTIRDKLYLEKLLGMATGYVDDFTDATFGDFFQQYNVDIHGSRYQKHGTSKASKLRAFWTSEPNEKVIAVLSGILDRYEMRCELYDLILDRNLLDSARNIVERLRTQTSESNPETAEGEFLSEKFAIPNIRKLPVNTQVVSLVEERLREAHLSLNAGAYLAVIVLCGSVLEAVLLGAAQKDPARFNKAKATPRKDDGSAKRFYEWSLGQLIDVAHEAGLLKLDIKKFSHGLRDFRNYIHPNEQLKSEFTPDEHTAKVCFQVLSASLASLAGERV